MNKTEKISEKQTDGDLSEANMSKWKEVNSRLQKLCVSKCLVRAPEELESLERAILKDSESFIAKNNK